MCSRPAWLQIKTLSQKQNETNFPDLRCLLPLALPLTLRTHLTRSRYWPCQVGFPALFPKATPSCNHPQELAWATDVPTPYLCSAGLPTCSALPPAIHMSPVATSDAIRRQAAFQRCTCPVSMRLPWLFEKSALYTKMYLHHPAWDRKAQRFSQRRLGRR